MRPLGASKMIVLPSGPLSIGIAPGIRWKAPVFAAALPGIASASKTTAKFRIILAPCAASRPQSLATPLSLVGRTARHDEQPAPGDGRLFELDDDLVDREAVAGLGGRRLDRRCLGRAEDILHLHRFHHRDRLAG